MRVLLGLAALAASVSAQTTTSVSYSGPNNSGIKATFPPVGSTANLAINIFENSSVPPGAIPSFLPAGATANGIQTGNYLPSNNWALQVPTAVTTLVFVVTANQYTSQLQYRWSPNYPSPATNYPNNGLTAQSYTCDICTGGNTPISCNTSVGPIAGTAQGTAGAPCANLARTYTLTGLQPSTPAVSTPTSFGMQVFDIQSNPSPNVSSYSFTIYRIAPAIIGDPQIVGMQGQDFQVHGMPDEIFNMITYPNLQVNARFVYLSSGACHDNFTACFAHPGTYISEEGIRLGSDKIHVQAGSFKKGLTVSVNGKKITDKKTSVKLGSVELLNHRRVVVKTPIMAITISNSDKFLNQETQLYDSKLLGLGAERKVLGDGESFHSEIPLHGLQGQTWRNIEYPSGLDYEGSISDYHVTSGNLYGTEFVFNQFKQ